MIKRLTQKQEGDDSQERLKNLLRIRKEKIQVLQKLYKKRSLLTIDIRDTANAENSELGQPTKKVKVDELSQQNQQHTNKVCFKNQQGKQRVKESKKNSQQKNTENKQLSKIKNDFQQRNKRMFGGLNGYLKKAKSNIEAEKPEAQKKIKIMEQIKQKQRQRNQQLARNQINKIQAQIKEHEQIKEKNAKDILQLENSLLLSNYTNYTNKLKHFIFTKTEPVIAWLPAKQLDVAKKLLGQKQRELQVENQKIAQTIRDYEQVFDYNTYLVQNQKQYYTNLTKKYYNQQTNFYITKQQPRILWKPSKQLASGSTKVQLKQQLSQFTEQKLNSINEKTEKYYTNLLTKMNQKNSKQQKKSTNQVLSKLKADHSQSDSNSPFNYVKIDQQDD